MVVTFAPANITTEVKSVEMHHESIAQANQVTTSVSTSKTSPSKISEGVTSLLTPKMTPRKKLSALTPKSSSLTTQVKSAKVTLQFWIAILPILPASFLNFLKKLTGGPVKRLKTTHPRLNLVMPASLK